MRIRTVKPEFFLHAELYEAEKYTKLPLRVAFAGLWCAADREGRFKWEPRRLGVCILPYDGVDFSRVLDALTTRGFLVKYASGDAFFGFIPSFHKHQVINNRERASDIPEPPDKSDTSDASGTREVRVDDACRKEGKGKEGNREQIVFPSELDTQEFAEAWKEWKRYRSERRKALTPSTEARQLKQLAPFGAQWAVQRIGLAIERAWSGLVFDGDKASATQQPSLPKVKDLAAEACW